MYFVMVQRVNFSKMDSGVLKRYRRFYKLGNVGPNPSKEQLAHAVTDHFMSQVMPCLLTHFLLHSMHKETRWAGSYVSHHICSIVCEVTDRRNAQDARCTVRPVQLPLDSSIACMMCSHCLALAVCSLEDQGGYGSDG